MEPQATENDPRRDRSPSDGQLVAQALAGAKDAFDELIRRYQRQAVAVSYRLLGNSQDSLEVTQDAFLKAFTSLATLQKPEAFGGWLMRILVRTCRRLLLGRSHRAEVTANDEIAAPGVPVELRRDLVQALAGLPAPYREVVVLRDVEEWTAPEVATELGISVEAVKSRLHRARAMMRERLDASAYWA